MILSDVNVLVYAFREDAADHRRFRHWLEATIDAPEAFGIADAVLSSFVRVVTNPRIFREPALAIESGCEGITTDRDYARFAGLRWRHPF